MKIIPWLILVQVFVYLAKKFAQKKKVIINLVFLSFRAEEILVPPNGR